MIARASIVVVLALLASAVAVFAADPPAGDAPGDAIDQYVRSEIDGRHIPGLALAVIRDGAVVKLAGYGLASIEHDARVTPDTVFDLGAVTKPFTATAIMTLVEDGKLALDDSITKYLPKPPSAWSAITVRHLLSHTGGFPADGFQAVMPRGADRLHYPRALLYGAAVRVRLESSPGEKFIYNDVDYFLLGLIIENVSGQRYQEFLAGRFFTPLGMTSTSVFERAKIVKRRASEYAWAEGSLARLRRDIDVDPPSDSGLMSSVRDLATWDLALAEGRIVSAATLARMWTPTPLRNGSAARYGLGWGLAAVRGHRTVYHPATTGAEYARFPDDGLTVIVLTNLAQVPGIASVNPWGVARGVASRYVPALAPATPAEPATPGRRQ